MRAFFFVLLLSFVSLFNGLQAQPYYFSMSMGTYAPLTGGNSVNQGAVWSGFQTFTIPVGFNFDYMGTTYTSVKLEATGRLIFDAGHYHFADMFVVNGLQDRGTSSSESPITYQLSGSPGSQVFTIQIKNANFNFDTAATVDFQIWLHEGSNNLQLRMGPNSIPNPPPSFAPSSGVFNVSSWSPLTYSYALLAYGDPNAAADTTISGAVSTSGLSLNGAPAEGMIYTYGTSPPVGIERSLSGDFHVGPNPTSGGIVIESESESGEVEVYDLFGKMVDRIKLSGKRTITDLSDLPAGTYLLRSNGSCVKVIRE